MTNFTDEQIAIIDNFRTGASGAVNAVAGSGKTTTAVAAAQYAKPGTLAVAFGKKNQLDLEARMPSYVTSKTMNALGNAAWKTHTGKFIKLDGKKPYVLWDSSPFKNDYTEREDVGNILRLFKLARNIGISSGYNLPAPDTEALLDAADEHDIDDAKNLLDPALWLLRESCVRAFRDLMDFDDQIYMPVMYGSPFTRYDSVIVDEAQDLSALQHRMVERSLARGGQLTILGDPHQAIYHFRGASSTSFHDLVEKFSLPNLPLYNSFRCPRAVVAEAQKYVPHIRAAGTAEGHVEEVEDISPAPRVTAICRTNAPIVKLAFESIRAGIPVNYLGRDFLAGIKSLHKKHPTKNALQDWFASETAKAKSDAAKAKITDRFETLMVLHATGRRVEDAIKALTTDADARAMQLSTIHRFKGLEAETVIYVNYGKPDRGLQADNIRYVGVTRAKQNLILHYPEEQPRSVKKL